MSNKFGFLQHLSYSSINQFDNCPRCWYLKYKYKYQTPPSDDLTLGSVVHKAVENYHKGIKQSWNIQIPNKKWTYTVADFMKPYTEIYLPEHHDQVELRFNVELLHPLDSKKLDLPFQVVIDRVWGDTLHDLKTSSSYYKDSVIDTKYQHSLYAYAYEQKYKVRKNRFIYDVIVKNKTPKMQVLELDIMDSDIHTALMWVWSIWNRMQVLEMPKTHTPFCWNKGMMP